MFTLATDPLKKCLSEPRALFSVSRSSSVNGISLASNHSARATIRPVLPTPPFPPIVKTTRLFFASGFIAILLGQRASTARSLQSESAWALPSAQLALLSARRFERQRRPGLLRPSSIQIRAVAVRTETAFGAWHEP